MYERTLSARIFFSCISSDIRGPKPTVSKKLWKKNFSSRKVTFGHFFEKILGPRSWVENSTLTLKFSALRSKGVKRSFAARITLVMMSDESWLMMTYLESLWVTMSHNESQWATMSYHESPWVTMSHDESLCVMMTHHESQWVTMSHNESQ